MKQIQIGKKVMKQIQIENVMKQIQIGKCHETDSNWKKVMKQIQIEKVMKQIQIEKKIMKQI